MLRPTLFSLRKLEMPAVSLAISVVPARTLRWPTAGIGTELLAHREKIEITRSGSPFARSPVPMRRAPRPYTHEGRASPRRIADMPDSLAEDAVSSELLCDEVGLMAARSFGHDIG